MWCLNALKSSSSPVTGGQLVWEMAVCFARPCQQLLEELCWVLEVDNAPVLRVLTVPSCSTGGLLPLLKGVNGHTPLNTFLSSKEACV